MLMVISSKCHVFGDPRAGRPAKVALTQLCTALPLTGQIYSYTDTHTGQASVQLVPALETCLAILIMNSVIGNVAARPLSTNRVRA